MDQQLHRMIVSLGSNTPDRAEQMACALEWLKGRFWVECASPVYNTRAWRSNAPDYLNQVVVMQAGGSPARVQALCKDYEQAHGRTPEAKRCGLVSIDLDLMWSDGQWLRPHERELPYFAQGYAEVENFLSK